MSRKVLKDYYEHIREEEKEARADRIREAADKIAGMSEILAREAEIASKITSLAAKTGARGEREELREERKNLEEARRSLLTGAGYPADHMDRRYRCDICKDTGYTDEGRICECARARADEAYLWINGEN